MGPEASRGIGPFDREDTRPEYVGTGFTPEILARERELMGTEQAEQPEVEGAIDE